MEMNLVFIKANVKCMDADTMIKRRFNKVLDETGIAKIRFQDLRHAYGRLAKDVDIKYIQKQMWHASFEIHILCQRFMLLVKLRLMS